MLNIPQGIKNTSNAVAAIGDTVVVPVNVLDPNPVNSGGLGNVTIGINYDATVFDPTNISVSEGDVNSAAGWTSFTANTANPGQIIITTSQAGGPPPIFSTTGGSLANITFTVIGLPSNSNGGSFGTSLINLASAVPQTSQLDVIATGTPVSLPMAFAPQDNTSFNTSTPGVDDGTVELSPGISPSGTTTTVSAAVGGSSVTTVTYGTHVTLTASVTISGGGGAPTGGTVDFKDGTLDLTPGGVTGSVSGSNEIFTYITTSTQLQVLQLGGGVHGNITANFTGSPGNSTGTLTPGLTVTPAPLTITAQTNAKTYDGGATAAAVPTVSGLFGTDRVDNRAEVYSNGNAGSSKTLSVSAYTVQDNNGGLDYTVTTVTNTTGSISKANLTVTALANTKNFDSNVSATTKPTVSGLVGTDTATNLIEVYSDPTAGTGKTLSVSAYTIGDGNGGNNYTVTTALNAQGEIDQTTGFATTTTVQSSSPSVAYGTPVTFTVTVTATGGSAAPTGTVDVTDNSSHDLGNATFVSSSGLVSTFTLTTLPKTLNVTVPAAHVITASYSGASFGSSSNTLAGGQTVTAKALTITATTNAKTYDATTSAAAAPTVSGLVGTDTVTGLTEVYSDKNVGTSKTLSVTSTYTVSDNNGGNNYTVTTVTNTTGSISKANLTVTALANTKNFDSNVSATTKPTVSGLLGTDTATNLAEVYADPNVGTGKALSVSAYTIGDGNGGNNYTVTTQPNAQGEIDQTTGFATTTTVQSSSPSVTYGTPVTFTVTVTATGGSAAPTGTVDVTDNSSHDLGNATFVSSSGLVSTFTLTTLPKTLNVTVPAAHVITASYSGTGFGSSSSSLAGGQTVTAKGLTITASTNTKTYDSTTSATAAPTVSGLVGTDSVTGLAEVYSDKNVGTSKTLSVTSAYTVNDNNGGNNYTVTTVTNTTGSITKANLTVTASTNTKTYNSTTSAAAAPTVTGLVGADSVSGATEVYSTSTGGSSKTLSVNAYTVNDGNSGNNYNVTTATNTTGAITKANLTITATTNAKTYDATSSATAAPTVSGLIGTDSVAGLVEVYSDKNVGTSKTLSVSAYTVNDSNGGNSYTVTTVTNTTGSISKANLTVTALANTKNFDSNVSATTKPTVTGLLGTDTATNLAEVYADPNVGTGKTLSVSAYTIGDGNAGNNYTVTTQPNAQGEIDQTTGFATTTTVQTSQPSVAYGTPVTFTVTVTATGGSAAPTGTVDVTDNSSHDLGNATFVSSSGLVSTFTLTTLPKTLNVTVPAAHVITASYSGASFGSSSNTLAGGQTVTAKALTITATTNAKTYDATTSAAAAPTVSGLVGTDTVTGLTEVYSDKNVGTSKTLSVTSTYTVSDNNGGNNYTVTTVTNTTGSISKANLTVTALANTKNFDSNVSATTKPTVSGLLGTDTATNLAEVYADPNVGTGKTLSVSAYTIGDGNGGNNYTVTTQPNAQGEIDQTTGFATTTTVQSSSPSVTYGTPVTFTVTVTATGGSAAPTGTVDVTDNSSHDLGNATFVSSSGLVSTFTLTTLPKTLNVTVPAAHVITASYSGTGFGSSSNTLAGGQTVTAKALTITATTNAKTYDATTSAAAAQTVSGLVGTDSVAGLTEVYSDKNVGTSKTLSVTGTYTVSDNNGGNNYTVTTVTNTTGSISKANLTVTALTNSKTYDSTTNAAATPTVTGLLGTDSVSGAKEVYSTASAGTGKTLSVSAYTVNDGNGSNNYSVTTVTNTTGVITKANLTITATTNNKTYDSTTTAGAAPTVSGLLGADSVSGLTEVYTTASGGTGKTLSVSTYTVNDSNGGNNYTVTTATNTTGVITKATLTITATTNAKTYDATTGAAAAPTVSGLIGTDSVTGLTEVYGDKNVGSSKTLSVSAYTVNDGNGGNSYTVTTVTNTTGSISKANLSITAVANTKNFDGNVTASALPTVAGLKGSDTVTGSAEVYADPTVGTGKTLSVSAYTVNDGNSGNNYTVTTGTNANGTILQVSGFTTTTTVQSSSPSVIYGTPVTFTITVTANGGSAAPGAGGSVDVTDNTTHDLGLATFVSSTGLASTYSLTTLPKTFNVTSPPAHVITASFSEGSAFGASTGTLAGGQTVTPARAHDQGEHEHEKLRFDDHGRRHSDGDGVGFRRHRDGNDRGVCQLQRGLRQDTQRLDLHGQ